MPPMRSMQRSALEALTVGLASLVGLGAMVGLGHLFAPQVGVAAYILFGGLGALAALYLFSPNERRRWRMWIIPATLVAVLSIWVGPEVNAALGPYGILIVDVVVLPLALAAAFAIERQRNQRGT